MTFIFLLILFFIIWPLVKVLIALYAVKKRTKNSFGWFGPFSRGQKRQTAWSRFQRKNKKKISREIGEYVDFEEISVTASESDKHEDGIKNEEYTVEQQIVDAEWVDIKKE